jgi:hypothetical protein
MPQLVSIFDPYSPAKFSTEVIIRKLNFARILLHELTHILLRQTLGDVNAYTPQAIGESVTECGLLAELDLFGERIDWQKTTSEIKNKNRMLNLEYCEKFFEGLFYVGVSTNKFEFDCTEANAVIANTPIIESAFDPGCPIKIRDFVFE